MNLQKIFLLGAIVLVSVLILQKWNNDYPAKKAISKTHQNEHNIQTNNFASDMPNLASDFSFEEQEKVELKSAKITIKTDVLQAEINSSGGDIVKLDLLKYPEYLSEDSVSPSFSLFSTIENNGDINYIAQSALAKTDGPNKKNKRPIYTSSKTYYELDGSEVVVDLYLEESGVKIVKRYTFHKGSYLIDMEYRIENNSSNVWSDQFYAQLKRDNSKDPSGANTKSPVNTYLGGAVKTQNELYKKLPFDSFAKEPFRQKTHGGYAAIGQHYFVAAWVPPENGDYTYYTKKGKDDFNFIGLFYQGINVDPGDTAIVGAKLYAGPKDQDVLKEIAEGLNLTIDYGMLWFLAQPLFVILQLIFSLFGNWGWSIIFLTIFVKAIFYPLNATSFRSMAKMRKITPKLQQIKEQYADDKQKLSQAMMDLYKKEKVNPLGGCLPIIIQMPVFIALYWVLLESVELRQSSWILWIKDLSVMDPYFILPVIMGASMFLQQTLNPPPADPMQAKVMKFMPLIFTFFFLWFPSGLVLYWITNNVISIIQQLVISKKMEDK